MVKKLENIVLTVPKKSFLQKITMPIAAAAFYMLTACSCGGNEPSGPDAGAEPDAIVETDAGYDAGVNDENPIEDVSSDDITPSDGTTVGPDDFDLDVDVPGVNPDYEGEPSDVEVIGTATYDNRTPSTADDETVVVFDTTAAPGSNVSGTVDVSAAHGGDGVKNGEGVKLEVIITALDDSDTPFERSATADVTYEYPVEITGCSVLHSNIGRGLNISCNADAQNPLDLISNWTVVGGPAGTNINGIGLIYSDDLMDASDEGLNTYTPGASDNVSNDSITFTVPVDECKSTLTLDTTSDAAPECGVVYILLLPETSVDRVGTNCGSGFNDALKPTANGQPDYVHDVDKDCVEGAIASLSTPEKNSHPFYNNGTLVSDVYSNCTVEFAQTRHHHD